MLCVSILKLDHNSHFVRLEEEIEENVCVESAKFNLQLSPVKYHASIKNYLTGDYLTSSRDILEIYAFRHLLYSNHTAIIDET